MAIRIIQGVPGSGKTYYAVRHLTENYFEKQEDGRYELVKPVTIVTNIDSFQANHIQLSTVIKDTGGVKNFFTEYYQVEFCKQFNHQVVYLIDEAQKFFRKNARDLNDVFTYFEIHRHLGHDIYLITQNVKKLPTDLVCLAEYIIDAAPRSRSVIGEFKYKWLSDGEVLKREGFRPDGGIFALYKSMDLHESEKISNPVMKTFYSVILLSFFVICTGVYYFKSKWVDSSDKSTIPVQDLSHVQTSTSSLSVSQSDSDIPSTISVRLDSGTVYVRFGEKGRQIIPVTYVFLGRRLYRVEKFPYPLDRVLGEYYATIPLDVAQQLGLAPRPATKEPVRRMRSDLSGASSGQVVQFSTY